MPYPTITPMRYTNVCIYIYIHTYVCMYISQQGAYDAYMCVHIYMFIYICAWIRICMYVCMYVVCVDLKPFQVQCRLSLRFAAGQSEASGLLLRNLIELGNPSFKGDIAIDIESYRNMDMW